MSKDKDADNKEYKGPGRFTSLVGRGSVESGVGVAAGAAVGAAIGAITKKGAHGAGAIGGMVGGAVGGLHGMYRGYKNAGAAREQVADLNQQNEMLSAQLAQEKSFTNALTQERKASAEAAQEPSGKNR